MALNTPGTGFRQTYLDYERLSAQLRDWADAHPGITQLRSIGQTPEGRQIWVLTIGSEPRNPRPAVWVDGNMHGGELAGSSVALTIAEAALRLHGEGMLPDGLPAHLLETLRNVHFHICPRISPDGAEAVLRRGGFVRSAPRRQPHAERAPHWRPVDLDGDGVCRYLRVRDEAGDFIESSRHPGLMLPRRIDDPPPYWRLYPEGVIEHWDGERIPEPELLRGTPDFNRNFPWSWKPEPHQSGAGEYPGSEPETRAVMDFAAAHPNLYAWLNLHTFGGVFIRPAQDVPDSRMDQQDLALYRQLGVWGEQHTGYPTVSGYEEFTYEPEKPLHGDLTDFAYYQRGCLAEVCELWDLFRRIDLPRPRRFVEHYTALSRRDMEKLARWDSEHNSGRVFLPWTPLEHPQLGAVEVGGQDPRVGIWNPPPNLLPGVCEGMTAYWLRVAALLPRLHLEQVECLPAGEGVTEIRLAVANLGYLPTNGVAAGRDLPWNTPVQAEILAEGCMLREGQPPRRSLGHLDGWGRGLADGSQMPWFQRSRGTGNRAYERWLVHGRGEVTVRVGSPRLGQLEHRLRVGGNT